MPAAPEFGDVRRQIRPLEVRRKAIAEQARAATRDVGVAGEVEIDLQREREHAHPRRHIRAAPLRVVKICIGYRCIEVRQRDFLEQAFEDFTQTPARILIAQRERLADLWKEMHRADDRAGDQVREERDEQREIKHAALCTQIAAININGVGDAFEGEEADADRQHDAQGQRVRVEMQQTREGVGEEVEVFEEAEYAEVEHDRASQRAAPRCVFVAIDPQAEGPVRQRR